MSYIDGFVIPVPDGNKEAYRKLAQQAAGLFRRLGAIRVVECWSHDIPDGEVTDFRKSVKAEGSESVVFSWIEWPSEVRDKGNKAMMDDPMMKDMQMPFDGKRMFFGGFEVLIDTMPATLRG